ALARLPRHYHQSLGDLGTDSRRPVPCSWRTSRPAAQLRGGRRNQPMIAGNQAARRFGRLSRLSVFRTTYDVFPWLSKYVRVSNSPSKPIEKNCTPINSSITLKSRNGFRVIQSVGSCHFISTVVSRLKTPSAIDVSPA